MKKANFGFIPKRYKNFLGLALLKYSFYCFISRLSIFLLEPKEFAQGQLWMLLSRRLRTLLRNLPRLRKNGKCRGFLVQCTSLLRNRLLPSIYRVPSAHYLKSLTPSLGFWGFGQTKMKTCLWLRQSMGWFHRVLSSPISSSKQVKEALKTLHIQCQILTCQIWGTSQLSLLRNSCCTFIPLKYLWIKPLNMKEWHETNRCVGTDIA